MVRQLLGKLEWLDGKWTLSDEPGNEFPSLLEATWQNGTWEVFGDPEIIAEAISTE